MESFSIHVPQAEVDDLRRRLEQTRWLEPTYGDDPAYGASPAFVRSLVGHWLHRFDWRAVEERINAIPNIVTKIEGLRIHALHLRSANPDAVPLILIHGWPSSFLEFLDIAAALAAPSDGGPAFHVVVPSIPGYGFSQTRPGISPRFTAEIFAELMTRLGHDRFMIQGANWGSTIATIMARRFPERVLGLHLNSLNGSPPSEPVALTEPEQAMAERYGTLLSYPHFNLVSQAPVSIAHALNDSPAGLAAWMGEKLRDWADPCLPGNPGLDPDWILSNAALYWFTGTSASAAALYREAVLDTVPEAFVAVPTAVAAFARELVLIPRPWAEKHYDIVQWNSFDRGGHFAAIEVPHLFIEDLRDFARLLSR